jgi:hypothetical protein
LTARIVSHYAIERRRREAPHFGIARRTAEPAAGLTDESEDAERPVDRGRGISERDRVHDRMVLPEVGPGIRVARVVESEPVVSVAGESSGPTRA